MRRRVVILTNLFPFPEDRTRGIFNLQQFQVLSTQHELLVVVPIPFRQWKRGYATVTTMSGIAVRYFPFYYPPGFARSLHEWCLWRSLLLGPVDDLRNFSADCILGCWLYPDGVTAARIAKEIGVPLVLKAHGTDLNQRRRGGLVTRRIRAAVARAASLVVVSRALLRRAEEIGLDVARSQVIYNGVASETFSLQSRAECRARLGFSSPSKLVVFVGNLKASKGCVDLLGAAPAVLRTHPDTKFCFVGSGPAADELLDRARRLGLEDNVVLAGRQAHDRVVDWMGASDVVALPSHAEGVPNVLLEAMACGRPVVATNVGGVPEIVSPISGRLVPPRDPVALANAIASALGASWSERMIRDSVMQFTWQRSGRSLAQAIEAATSNSAR